MRQLCDANDIIFLQETRLTFEELSMLKSVHADFYADGVTAMDTSSGLLLGRPFGGIAILWRKSIGDCIQIHKYNDSRVMAIEYNNGNRKLLAVNIYMPCDDRSTNSANYDEFIKYLGMMHAIIHDCDISSVYIIGDWNAGFNGNSVFGKELSSFCLEHDYVLSDIDHLGALSGSFTFVSEAHGTASWIDHCLCTTQAHASLVGVNIDYGMQSSDHFSISICIDVESVPRLESESVPTQTRLNWSKASARDKSAYTDKCADLLSNIKLPREAVCCCNTSCEDGSHIEDIQCLYYNIANCLHGAASDSIPSSKSNCLRDKNITPGWNDFVKAAHSEARDAFKFWIRSSKPRHGEVFNDMKTSRSKFKYLLRQCKRNEASIRADILARDLCNKDPKSFWKNVSKQNNSSTNLADTVGGATGRDSIASMWSSHFSQLFNCVTFIRIIRWKLLS